MSPYFNPYCTLHIVLSKGYSNVCKTVLLREAF